MQGLYYVVCLYCGVFCLHFGFHLVLLNQRRWPQLSISMLWLFFCVSAVNTSMVLIKRYLLSHCFTLWWAVDVFFVLVAQPALSYINCNTMLQTACIEHTLRTCLSDNSAIKSMRSELNYLKQSHVFDDCGRGRQSLVTCLDFCRRYRRLCFWSQGTLWAKWFSI